ncbi:MAG: nucleotidyltransferase domain-containing protein [Phycisphaerae bacterium]|nr:nucleotidyltransferase domain-containing protein [Phycisphaerae bacterium]
MVAKPDQNILKTVGAYVDVLRANQTEFESIWLFGSFAEKRADEDSDIDIALVMPAVKVKFFKEVELTRYRREIDSRIEPHIINAADLESPFYQEVVLRGVKIA